MASLALEHGVSFRLRPYFGLRLHRYANGFKKINSMFINIIVFNNKSNIKKHNKRNKKLGFSLKMQQKNYYCLNIRNKKGACHLDTSDIADLDYGIGSNKFKELSVKGRN